MRGYSLDPHPSVKVVTEQYAVVRIPRVKRERVPANNVEIVENLEQAVEKSDPKNHLYAAKVLGPSRSSEGVILYYILDMYNHS
ncbi:hypothetical protein [Candidatus Thioglobus sp.]|jgi:hypothetical protein|uniref:hypothetical protein n=1 Tax=Candidatus Thioglobus sp. TaxID=2026721 RepID=UPI001DFD4C8B|nr:hypothetical protein [Candidatus Thioglobus sp.]MBT3277049.1 hypothetical protein [Candidatus Thioglobus sp.]MBT3447272.1 hypothetical protein [Candidatus Thioglobus sp.]MBT3744552.1 hypothetical protein [Candidatus Thioglobus sp.]MBT4001519.1 hypothetical protein [Candidatus Thioglobus sp.]MBT4181634.1 hypothetical protein [Candidatus Thioglobus sp.]